MGVCWSLIRNMTSLSSSPLRIADEYDCNGNEEDYHKRFLEDQVLGEGEFGIVKLVHDVTAAASASSTNDGNNSAATTFYACKMLRKGVVFKDNVLYSPIKPDVLRTEICILRTLADGGGGEHYCLQLQALYETPKVLYLITEYCAGGEMMEYCSLQAQDLLSEHVSRIAFQLLSAVKHCAAHAVIHRDIKPENVMFVHKSPTADLRLIDFGSGCIDIGSHDEELIVHTTFAGSAFYSSPEMFQRSYTNKTDVWSAGVTLYVLVAGYPAHSLQKAFNILQCNRRNLRTLPQLPDNCPGTFVQLLEQLLIYRHGNRPSAKHVLETSEFVQFHQLQQQQSQENQDVTNNNPQYNLPVEDKPLSLQDVSAAAASAASSVMMESGGGGKPAAAAAAENGSITQFYTTNNTNTNTTNNTTTTSVRLRGSVHRHGLFLGFKKYERSLTTLLAACLTKAELAALVSSMKTRLMAQQQQQEQEQQAAAAATSTMATSHNHHHQDGEEKPSNSTSTTTATNNSSPPESENQQQPPAQFQQRLHVIPVSELKTILKVELKNEQVLATMEKLPGAELYENFAYHVALLRDISPDVFVAVDDEFGMDPDSSRRQRRRSVVSSSSSSGKHSNKNNKKDMVRTNSFGHLKTAVAGSNAGILTESNGSIRSTQSLRSARGGMVQRHRQQQQQAAAAYNATLTTATANTPTSDAVISSVHGANSFSHIRRTRTTTTTTTTTTTGQQPT